MSRAVRIEFEGAFYHVMSRGVARMPTFLGDDDRQRFLKILGGLVERGVLEVHAFCLMPNHYHLLLRTPQAGLARWMRHVNGDYVRGFNFRHRRVGPSGKDGTRQSSWRTPGTSRSVRDTSISTPTGRR